MNRYHASQVRTPSGPLDFIRALRARLMRPKGLASLADSALLARPLRLVNAHCISIGERSIIGRNTLLQPITGYLEQTFTPTLIIGNDCYVGPDCQFHCVNRIEVAEGCVLSDQVYVSDVGHGMDPRQDLIMDQPVSSKGPVTLGAHSFVGFGAVLLSGVALGERAVVGARSVVTRSVPAFTMVAGNPARPIARFDPEAGEWLRLQTREDSE